MILTVTINPVVTTGSSLMTNDTKNLSRGLLSKKTGVNSETIRYYEKIRLMPEPLRSASGYRIYDDSHLKRLSFIKRCRELGVKCVFDGCNFQRLFWQQSYGQNRNFRKRASEAVPDQVFKSRCNP